MVRTRITLVTSALVLAFAALPGCAAKNSAGDEKLGVSEDLLVADDSEAAGTDDSSEAEEEATSGGVTPDDGAKGVDPSGDEAKHLGAIKENAGRFFTPAGCLVSTIDKNVVTHVFTNCVGVGGRMWNGTVTATWTRPSSTSVQVVRVAKGFKIRNAKDTDTATIDRTVTVTYSKEAGVFKRVRTVEMDGTSEKGKTFSRDASWTVTWDGKCVTRDGSSQTVIGGREHSTTIEGYKRCNIGFFGCPDAGKITLLRKAGKGADKEIKIVIVFDGGSTMSIELPNGRKFEKAMACREAAKAS